MPTVTEELRTLAPPDRDVVIDDVLDDVAPPPRPPGHDGGGDDGGGGWRPSFPVSPGRIILWLVLTVVTMLFAGFTSAYIILRGVPTWQNVALPGTLWINTFVLLASSLTMDWTRRRVQAGDTKRAKLWMGMTALLGAGFLVGQVVAWNRLAAAGVYLATTLHSSFLYVLTGMHALHVAGGIAALGYVTTQLFRNRYTAASHEPVALASTYWHFMDALWVYLFLLFILA